MVHKLSLIASLLHSRNLLDSRGRLRGARAPGGRGALGASAALEEQQQQQLLLLCVLLVLV